MTAELIVGHFYELKFTLADTKMCRQFVPGSRLAGRIQLYVYSLGAESQQEIVSRACIFLLWEKNSYYHIMPGHPGLITQANSFIYFIPGS